MNAGNRCFTATGRIVEGLAHEVKSDDLEIRRERQT
jgi:hypothetical protein